MSIDAAKPLLDFIAKPESGGDYNIVWGGIRKADRPRKPLVKMTIGQVLAWQDSIDAKYMSEAAGRYQIMEDTLRPMFKKAGFDESTPFHEFTQDALAFYLLRRRGWDQFQRGEMSVQKFANSLAKEWASLPVVSGPKKGRSYYGGDGLNKSHVSVDAFLDAVSGCLKPVTPIVDDLIPPAPAKPNRWAALAGAIIAIFRKVAK